MATTTAARPLGAGRPTKRLPTGGKPGRRSGVRPPDGPPRSPDPILFQTYVKGEGGRTYAAQLKRSAAGRRYLILTEGERDPRTGELRKSNVSVPDADLAAFFHLLREMAQHLKSAPRGRA